MSDYCCNKIIESIVHQLDKVVPNISNMLDLVANVISETRLPLKESTSTQQAPEEKQENNIIKRKHPDDNVHVLALKALGVYCILDKEMAKKYLMVFFYQFSAEQENPDIWVIALKGIFDLLLSYGLEYFEILQIPEERSGWSRMLYTHDVDSVVSLNGRPAIEDNSRNFVHILTGLLDNANQELRTIAAEGLCKLLLNRRISSSSSLVSRLIILCYNPANDDDVYLRQCLCAFFDHFAIRVPDAPERFESAYFPAVRVICNAPDISPLQSIDTYHVSIFILTSITRSSQKFGKQVFDMYNNLAFAILAEILNPDSTINQETLIKSLTVLCVQFEDGPSKENLQEDIERVTNMV
ncbi:Condensin complex subunit 3 [Harpegnathos saltator]|uniref:Condensin complex subunit 3 n=1 Tax=Harpegnathos saltator TaxID=610380 RepID=E2BW36_HARSA|nr:Condensin complex subunit 3 [Harpegnathos saltator]